MAQAEDYLTLAKDFHLDFTRAVTDEQKHDVVKDYCARVVEQNENVFLWASAILEIARCPIFSSLQLSALQDFQQICSIVDKQSHAQLPSELRKRRALTTLVAFWSYEKINHYDFAKHSVKTLENLVKTGKLYPLWNEFSMAVNLCMISRHEGSIRDARVPRIGLHRGSKRYDAQTSPLEPADIMLALDLTPGASKTGLEIRLKAWLCPCQCLFQDTALRPAQAKHYLIALDQYGLLVPNAEINIGTCLACSPVCQTSQLEQTCGGQREDCTSTVPCSMTFTESHFSETQPASETPMQENEERRENIAPVARSFSMIDAVTERALLEYLTLPYVEDITASQENATSTSSLSSADLPEYSSNIDLSHMDWACDELVGTETSKSSSQASSPTHVSPASAARSVSPSHNGSAIINSSSEIEWNLDSSSVSSTRNSLCAFTPPTQTWSLSSPMSPTRIQGEPFTIYDIDLEWSFGESMRSSRELSFITGLHEDLSPTPNDFTIADQDAIIIDELEEQVIVSPSVIHGSNNDIVSAPSLATIALCSRNTSCCVDNCTTHRGTHEEVAQRLAVNITGIDRAKMVPNLVQGWLNDSKLASIWKEAVLNSENLIAGENTALLFLPNSGLEKHIDDPIAFTRPVVLQHICEGGLYMTSTRYIDTAQETYRGVEIQVLQGIGEDDMWLPAHNVTQYLQNNPIPDVSPPIITIPAIFSTARPNFASMPQFGILDAVVARLKSRAVRALYNEGILPYIPVDYCFPVDVLRPRGSLQPARHETFGGRWIHTLFGACLCWIDLYRPSEDDDKSLVNGLKRFDPQRASKPILLPPRHSLLIPPMSTYRVVALEESVTNEGIFWESTTLAGTLHHIYSIIRKRGMASFASFGLPALVVELQTLMKTSANTYADATAILAEIHRLRSLGCNCATGCHDDCTCLQRNQKCEAWCQDHVKRPALPCAMLRK